MGRKATGQVMERRAADGSITFALRFRAYGKRRFVALGRADAGWDHGRAQEELQNVLADVRRGIWMGREEPEPVAEPRPEPTFREFASEWYEARRLEGGHGGRGLSESASANLRWQLTNHLLPFFHHYRLGQITVEDVDRYRRAKLAEGCLSAGSINKTLSTLAAVLEVAVEYGLLDRNVAKGRRRRLPAGRPAQTAIDSAAGIAALLDAAGDLDRRARYRRGHGRALLATLAFAGLRISEALGLRWRDVNLAAGRLTVRGTKTDAADRTVNLLPALREELAALKARRDPAPGDYLFPTVKGTRQSKDNANHRIFRPALALANDRREAEGEEPLPRLTPHSLRRTFASVLVALGEDPAYVMAQMGHTDAKFTLSVYAKAMQRRDGERERLRALVNGEAVAQDIAADLVGPPVT